MEKEFVLGCLLGIFSALAIAEALFIRVIYKFLKSYDVDIFSDDWYPVRIRKYPFTLE